MTPSVEHSQPADWESVLPEISPKSRSPQHACAHAVGPQPPVSFRLAGRFSREPSLNFAYGAYRLAHVGAKCTLRISLPLMALHPFAIFRWLTWVYRSPWRSS
jgi:hypothetical protein